MSINRKGNLILFTGSSGVGKGTIIKELLDRDKNIRPVSYTHLTAADEAYDV